MNEADKNYEKIFVTKTGFGLKKKYYPDAIKKSKSLPKENLSWQKTANENRDSPRLVTSGYV